MQNNFRKEKQKITVRLYTTISYYVSIPFYLDLREFAFQVGHKKLKVWTQRLNLMLQNLHCELTLKSIALIPPF